MERERNVGLDILKRFSYKCFVFHLVNYSKRKKKKKHRTKRSDFLEFLVFFKVAMNFRTEIFYFKCYRPTNSSAIITFFHIAGLKAKKQ